MQDPNREIQYSDILRAWRELKGEPNVYEAIAAHLGLKIGTVKSRLHRARAAMKVKAATERYENGAPKWAEDGTLLSPDGGRSGFDDVDA